MSRSCPSPAELERAFWLLDPRTSTPTTDARVLVIADHVHDCEACRRQWDEIGALAEACGKVEPRAVSHDRREELRTKVLASMNANTRVPRRAAPSWRWWMLAPTVAAAAGIVLWIAVPRNEPAAPKDRRAETVAYADSKYLVASPGPDEVVRLVDGTLVLRVPALRTGERFRVMTLDSEIEANNAAFDAVAKNDRLASVRVIHGSVLIRGMAGDRTLKAGETWRTSEELAAPAPSVAPTPAPDPARTPAPDPAPTPAPAAVQTPTPSVRTTTPTPPAIREPEPVAASEPAQPTNAAVAEPKPRELDPAFVAFQEGWTQLKTGEFRAAADKFDQIRWSVENPGIREDAVFWSGVAHARAGDIDLAIDKLVEFTKAFPTSARAGEAATILGWQYMRRGDHGAARRSFESARNDSSPRIRSSALAGLRALDERSH